MEGATTFWGSDRILKPESPPPATQVRHWLPHGVTGWAEEPHRSQQLHTQIIVVIRESVG